MPDTTERQVADSSRRKMLALLGGSASVSLAGCSALFGDGGDDGDDGDDGGDGGDGNTSTQNSPDDYATWADQAQAAWEFVTENTGPDAQEERNQRYVQMEEAARQAGVIHPYTHDKTRWYWYDTADIPKTGVLGTRYMQHNETTIDRDDNELREQINTFSTIDPVQSTDVYSGRVIYQIYNKLTNFRNGTLEVENELIESYDSNEDNTVLTFNLKQGVQFHNGTELTADDVVYTMRRGAASPNTQIGSFVTSMPVGLGMEYEEGEDGGVDPESLGVEAVDDYTVEMTLQAPHPNPLEILSYSSFAILPEGLVDDVPGYDGEYTVDEVSNNVAVGTGPFELESFTQDEDVQLTANDNYHGSGPELDSLYYLIVEQPEPVWTAAVEQNVDRFAIPINFFDSSQQTVDQEDDLEREVGSYDIEENGETVNYLGIDALGVSYYAMNANNVPEAVRKAVGYVMNREEIVNSFYKGVPTPAFTFTPPSIWPTGEEGHQEFVDNHPYGTNESDIEGATQVLEEAGFTPDDPYELTISTADSPTAVNVAENIQSKLAGTGVDASVEPTQFSNLLQNGYDGSLEMYGIGWSWSFPIPAYGLYPIEPLNTDTSGMPGENNGYYIDWQVNLEDEG